MLDKKQYTLPSSPQACWGRSMRISFRLRPMSNPLLNNGVSQTLHQEEPWPAILQFDHFLDLHKISKNKYTKTLTRSTFSFRIPSRVGSPVPEVMLGLEIKEDQR